MEQAVAQVAGGAVYYAVWTCIIVVTAILLAIGVWGYRIGKKTVQDYVLAGGTVGLIVLVFYAAFTICSAWTFYGLPGWTYGHGLGGMVPFYIIAHLCQVTLISVLGIKLWGLARYHGYGTPTSAIVDRYYADKFLPFFSIINLIFLITYLALQPVAIALGLNILTGAPMWVGFVYATIICVILAFLGGMRSVAWANVLLGIWFLIAYFGTFFYTIATYPGGYGAMVDKVMQVNPALFNNPDPLYGLTGTKRAMFLLAYGLNGLAAAAWVHLLFIPMTVRNPKVMKKYPVCQLLMFLAIFAVGALGGVLAHAIWPQAGVPALPRADQVFQAMANRIHIWWGAFVYIGALAAALSTMGTMVVASGSLISVDIYKRFINPQASEARVVWVTRILLAVLAVAASAFGYLCVVGYKAIGLARPVPIADFLVLIASPGFALNVPLLLGLFWKRATREAAVISYVVGFVLLLLGFFYRPLAAIVVRPLLLVMPVQFILFVVISYLTKPSPTSVIDKYFTQLNKVLYGES